MSEKLTVLLNALRQIEYKKWWLPAAAALAATGIVVALLWQNNGHYRALFGREEHLPVAQTIEVLGGEQIPYRVEPQSGLLLVREGDIPRARMALAAKGIAPLRPAGYELMDKQEVLGSSQFMQNVRFKRSLEGELAQSIMTLEPVVQARVHLGISETSSFVLNHQPASSASVMLTLRYGRSLNEEQVSAIVNLVAGSVPGLEAERVKVVDQHGTLLSDATADRLKGRDGKVWGALTQRFRQDIGQNLAQILTPLLGAENFRISVEPQINFNQVEETQERWQGEPRISNENLSQENSTEPQASGVPGSLSNRPIPTAKNGEANKNTSAPDQQVTRNHTQRQYQYDRDIRHVVRPGFSLEKLSVAVVLNNNAAQIKKWQQQDFSQLEKLLQRAAGINTLRGDEMTLTQLSFSAPEVEIIKGEPWWQSPATLAWATRIGIGLLALLVIIAGILPLLRRVAASRSAATQPADTAMQTAGSTTDLANSLPGNAFHGDDPLPPQESGLETKIAWLQTLAQRETDRVAEVIKQWISSNEPASGE